LPRPNRRFPPPWTAEDHLACFIVKDSTGQALAHIYYEVEPGRRSAAKLLSKDEAHYCGVYLKDTGNRKKRSSC
jgi:hypothetical protein